MERIGIVQGDITKLSVDAIVNAASSTLLGGGGVDGAIHRAGGPQILKECIEIRNQQGECPAGEAVITTGGRLPTKYVIHTVGPVWHGGTKGEAEKLASCYTKSLELAVQNGVRTVAFPCISTGVYGYPKQEAAQIAVKTVLDYLNRVSIPVEVTFVCYDLESYAIYKEIVERDR